MKELKLLARRLSLPKRGHSELGVLLERITLQEIRETTPRWVHVKPATGEVTLSFGRGLRANVSSQEVALIDGYHGTPLKTYWPPGATSLYHHLLTKYRQT